MTMELDRIFAMQDWSSDLLDEEAVIMDDDIDLADWPSLDTDAFPEPIPGSYALTAQRYKPTQAEWAEHKDRIINLYAKEKRNKKLRETIQILQQEHMFFASPKQYKDKLKLWGVEKNERRQPSVSKPSVRRPRRSSNVSTKTNLTMATDSTMSSEAVPCSVARISSRMLAGQHTLTKIFYYLESKLCGEGVLHFFGPVSWWPRKSASSFPFGHPAILNSSYSRAMVLTRSNCPKPAFTLFSRTSAAMEDLFNSHHPALSPSILDAFLEDICNSNPLSRATMLNEAIETATKIHGPEHPLTELCQLLQVSIDVDEEVDLLLWFCHKFCKLFVEDLKLGKTHEVSVYINLRYFEKLLQLKRYKLALPHLQNFVEPAFTSATGELVAPRGLEPACLCYLRRKAHLLRATGHYADALRTLHIAMSFSSELLSRLNVSMVGHPIAEETFRILDEYAHLLHERPGCLDQAVNLHEFALELCVAVRGEHDGKTSRMVAGHAQFCDDAGRHAQADALKIRFFQVFDEAHPEQQHSTFHKLPCENCGNGQDTQNFCKAHNQVDKKSDEDRFRIACIRKRLRELLQ